MPRVTFFKDRRFAQDRIRLMKVLILGAVLITGVAVLFYSQDLILALGDKLHGSPPPVRKGTVPARPSVLWDQSPQKAMGSLGAKEIPREALAENASISRSTRMFESGESAKALVAAETAATLGPNNPAAWHHAGAVAMGCGANDKARRYFQKALEIAPFAPPTLFNLAQLEFDAGNYTEASRLLGTFRQQDPRHRIAAYRAVVCVLMLGQKATLDPEALPEDSTAGLYARAAIALHGGDNQAAKALVEKARATGSKSASRFESDLGLLGFKE
jgi:tetratricopeptide (TPR) repeat protein